ncbi:hypothetical protein FUAX_02420 [Fulvitalea axinellae]|uniref:Lipoprotein n=1 Tax=Fulvitalea axinellae TaxID=1182444 RepID=A0AAU9DAA9_9BACT|nr:hypothetical protein FUAX_02420 [Fulvitalea axinellae]
MRLHSIKSLAIFCAGLILFNCSSSSESLPPETPEKPGTPDNPNIQLTVTRTTWFDSKNHKTGELEIKRDTKKREIVSERTDGDGRLIFRKETTYNDQSNTFAIKEITTDMPLGKPYAEGKFNSLGKNTKTTVYDEKGREFSIMNYGYDAKHRETQRSETLPQSSTDENHYSHIVYNDATWTSTDTNYRKTDDKVLRKVEYKYLPNTTKQTQEDHFNENGEKVLEKRCEYDQNQRIIRAEFRYPKSPKNSVHYTMSYNDKEFTSEQRWYNTQRNDLEQIIRHKYLPWE